MNLEIDEASEGEGEGEEMEMAGLDLDLDRYVAGAYVGYTYNGGDCVRFRRLACSCPGESDLDFSPATGLHSNCSTLL